MNEVYIIENQVNGKKYIGITTQGIHRRRTEHLSRLNLGHRDHKLYQAMRKYGMDNFKMYPLCSVFSKDDLPLLEVHFIKLFNTFDRGYNMTCGGDVVSDETKQKISKRMKGRNITWGKKIWESRRRNGNEGNPKEYVAKGADHVRSVSYKVMFPDGHIESFKGLRAFSRKHNLSHNLLIATLKNVQHHHKGFVLLATFNDYPEREYSQVAGSGARLNPHGKGEDIVWTA